MAVLDAVRQQENECQYALNSTGGGRICGETLKGSGTCREAHRKIAMTDTSDLTNERIIDAIKYIRNENKRMEEDDYLFMKRQSK